MCLSVAQSTRLKPAWGYNRSQSGFKEQYHSSLLCSPSFLFIVSQPVDISLKNTFNQLDSFSLTYCTLKLLCICLMNNNSITSNKFEVWSKVFETVISCTCYIDVTFFSTYSKLQHLIITAWVTNIFVTFCTCTMDLKLRVCGWKPETKPHFEEQKEVERSVQEQSLKCFKCYGRTLISKLSLWQE